MIQHVIVDSRFSINVMHVLIYNQLDIEELEPTNGLCQGYDKTRQTPFGQVCMPIFSARNTISVNVVVLNQYLDYNLLLGLPCIDET